MALVDIVFGHLGLKRACYCKRTTSQRLQTREVVTDATQQTLLNLSTEAGI